ncbi:hypothetical protein K8I61_05715 [bacterium]|nr:hypothetical protein [bacterium]
MTARTHAFWIVLITMAFAAFAFIPATAGCGGDDDDDDDDVDDDDATDDDVSDDDADDDAADDDENAVYDPADWGPYLVGNRRFIFTDTSRVDGPSRGFRTLLTEIWYPADNAAENLPPDTVGSFLENWKDLILAALGLLGAGDDELDNVNDNTRSVFNAPIHSTGGLFPVVLLSHGNQSLRFAHWTLAEYLASHGYVVVSADHIGNAIFVTLPDRLAIYSILHYPFALDARIGDMAFLADTVERLNANDPEGFFTGRLNTHALGAVGHSFGGWTVFDWAQADGRARAVVDMALPVDPADFDSDAALMLMSGGEDRTVDEWHPVSDGGANPSDGVYIEILDAGHYTFSNACFLFPTIAGAGDGCGEGKRGGDGEAFDYIDPALAFDIMNSYITAFFGYHLKGQDDMLPALTTNRYPGEILHRVAPPDAR